MVPVALQLVTGDCQYGNTDIHLDQIHLQNVLPRAVSSSTITHDDYQDTSDDGRFDSVPVLYPIGMEYVIKKTITEQSWAKLTHTRRYSHRQTIALRPFSLILVFAFTNDLLYVVAIVNFKTNMK